MTQRIYLIAQVPIEWFYAFLAISGGAARYAQQYLNGEPFNWRMFVAQVCISGFSGFIFALIAKSLGLAPEMSGVFAGVGGWLGSNGMEFASTIVKTRMKN